jgi:hypothetical protein
MLPRINNKEKTISLINGVWISIQKRMGLDPAHAKTRINEQGLKAKSPSETIKLSEKNLRKTKQHWNDFFLGVRD